LLVYFPMAVLIAALALRRPDRLSLSILAGVLGMALFYLLWIPDNFFGGATFVGNRYFLPAYAALLVALPRLPGPRSLIAVWTLAAVALASAAASASRARDRDYFSQSHAEAGIFALLPIESTAAGLEGRKERIWSDEFLRFWDSAAAVSQWGFQLTSHGRPALISVAHPRAAGLLRFVVFADRPGVELVFRDRGGEQRFPLAEARDGARGIVEIVPGPTWRRHPRRWQPDETWFTRPFTPRIEGGGGEPATAEVRYLGPYRPVPVRARNDGRRHWATHEAVPIQLSYRLQSLDNPKRQPIVGPATSVRSPVGKGGLLDTDLKVRWPRKPGRYELTIDLMLGGAAWFEEWTGQPLARGEVRVDAPETP
jgi:hypothetical protein